MTGEREPIAQLEAELDAARRERDLALQELAEARQHANRLRDRLEERIATVTEQLAKTEDSLLKARATLKRMRSEPATRLALLATRAARRTIKVGQALGERATSGRAAPKETAGTAPGNATAVAPFEAPLLDAAAFRSRFLASLPIRGTSPGETFHVAVLATEAEQSAGADAVTALDLTGFRGTQVGHGDAGHRWEPSIGAALVLSPAISRAAVPRQIVSIAWVRDDPEEWLADPRFDDHDLLLASDIGIADTLVQRTGKPVAIVPAASPLNLGPLVDALGVWARARKLAIHIGPRTWDDSAQWGDTPFARAIQRELERRGWPTSIHVVEDRETAPAVRADVSLHLIGGRVPEVRPGQISLLWVISHPDRITAALCDRYDAVFVASDLFAGHLARRTRTPVVPLHQATDPERFYPDPTGPVHELLFVGNSRRARRPILDALAGTTRDLAVYGTAWTPDLLDQRHLHGAWIPNEDLRRYYSSAAIVLNDHWRDMRDEGFISNRIYDALACGAFVISDQVPGLAREFDHAVATFEDPGHLERLIEHFLANPDERHERAERGRAAVLANHTFAQRAETILATLGRLTA